MKGSRDVLIRVETGVPGTGPCCSRSATENITRTTALKFTISPTHEKTLFHYQNNEVLHA